ncbi:FAD-dependent oxidoreductase [bacterium]|nr:FAD-dependent oxidoreductase [bacterium]
MTQNGSTAKPQIAIIGGGVAGLTAAYDLARTGAYAVHIFEASEQVGGLAAGFKGRSEWSWPLEKFYHHLFTNDDAILDLTRELDADPLLTFHRPLTVMHYQGADYPFDSPTRLLRFPHLSLPEKLRMGAVLAYLKYHPRPPWRTFDQIVADPWLERWMGSRGYRMLWRPMLEGKFGPHYQAINLAWFWARVYKRTPQLGYYEGGFQTFVDVLATKVRALGVTVETGVAVETVEPLSEGRFALHIEGRPRVTADRVLSTVSPGLMQRLTPSLPASYLSQLGQLKSMGAVVMTVALDRPLTQGIYWINVPKAEGLPFLALVEHTNMIDPAHYAGDHLLYLGDYLEPSHRYFEMTQDELLAEFLPALTRFNPNFEPNWVTGAWLHRAKYAQPVPVTGYESMIPSVRTPVAGLYFASMSQVYPWDRGTNYAVEMGRRVAKMINADQHNL